MNLPSPLSGAWRHLLFFNYQVPAELLLPYVPKGTELDLHEGSAYLSLVGLMFLGQTILGIPDPFHQSYEQVNLRFYLRRRHDDGWLHGAFFIKEIVPAALVTAAARLALNERYVTREMRHTIQEENGTLRGGSLVEYGWKEGDRWNSMRAHVAGGAVEAEEGSKEFFVAHRLVGYSPGQGGGTIEYRLRHPRWHLYPVADPALDCDIERVYGREFLPYLEAPPTFAFVAAGSDIAMTQAGPIG